MAGRASHGARAAGLLVLLGLAACASAKVKALDKACADGEAGAWASEIDGAGAGVNDAGSVAGW